MEERMIEDRKGRETVKEGTIEKMKGRGNRRNLTFQLTVASLSNSG